jgi:hypothetical protein
MDAIYKKQRGGFLVEDFTLHNQDGAVVVEGQVLIVLDQ